MPIGAENRNRDRLQGYPDYLDSYMGYTSSSPNRSLQSSSGSPPSSSGYIGGASGNSIGTLSFDPNANRGYSGGTGYGSSGSVAMQQHQRYIRNYRDFEEALIQSRQDTSLIDAVPEDVETQTRLAREIGERNKQRYGYTSTAVEESEAERDLQRGGALNLAGGLTNARLAQREQNMKLLGDLINIGQGVNRSSLSQLATADENTTMRKNAYQQAKAQHKSQTNQMIGSMGMALAAFLI